ESSQFADLVRYFISLGKTCLPSLVEILGAEQDRSMRKKMCLLITQVAREDGGDVLLNALSTPNTFLLRNLVMIIGDIKNSHAVTTLVPLLNHAQKNIRTEAVRSLCKIGSG